MSWKPHERLDDALLDLAAQYAMGTLGPEERAEYEAHLEQCGACRAAQRAHAELCEDLDRMVEAVEPPTGMWARVEAGVTSELQPWKRWAPEGGDAPAGMRVERAGAARFEPTAFPGVEVRRLAVDPSEDRVTMEVRMAAGSSYPPHVHGGIEECYVLAGDLQVGELEMGPGDYQVLPEGSEHPVQSTAGGCRLLIVSSTRDRLLEG